MRVSVWLVRQFIRLWPLRGGIVIPKPPEENVWYADPPRVKPRRRPLYLPTDEELGRRAYIRQLARDLREVPVSRRKFLDWVADEIYAADGRYVDMGGNPVSIGDPAEPLPPDEGKWTADFMKWADREPKQAIQKKVIPRIRSLAMARAAWHDRIGKTPEN